MKLDLKAVTMLRVDINVSGPWEKALLGGWQFKLSKLGRRNVFHLVLLLVFFPFLVLPPTPPDLKEMERTQCVHGNFGKAQSHKDGKSLLAENLERNKTIWVESQEYGKKCFLLHVSEYILWRS